MQLLKEEVCFLVGAITGSPRVSFVRTNHDHGIVEVLASSLGSPRTYDIGTAFHPIPNGRTSILLPSLAKFTQFLNHPIFDVIPNLHSLSAYLMEDTAQQRTFLIAWNPSDSFFTNDCSIALVERLATISKGVFFEKNLSTEDLSGLIGQSASNGGFADAAISTNSEPLSNFLFETLIPKKRLLARKGASYVALRQWRKSIKPYQVKALQALKSDEAPGSLDAISQEIIAQVESVYGKLFNTVVPIPGGSSGRKKSFSVLIAERVAQGLNIPCQDILISSAVPKGASHPKKSTMLQPYTLKQDVTGNVLIVDDVASSGKHIELATTAIKQHANYCTAVVWIAD